MYIYELYLVGCGNNVCMHVELTLQMNTGTIFERVPILILNSCFIKKIVPQPLQQTTQYNIETHVYHRWTGGWQKKIFH